MERITPLARLWRIRRSDCVLALIALAGVLIVGILAGLALAVGISLAMIVWRAGEGRLQLIGGQSASTDGTPEAASAPGPVARPLQMLFFVNAAEIRESVDAAASSTETHPDVVLLDLGTTPGPRRPGDRCHHGPARQFSRCRQHPVDLHSVDVVHDRLRMRRRHRLDRDAHLPRCSGACSPTLPCTPTATAIPEGPSCARSSTSSASSALISTSTRRDGSSSRSWRNASSVKSMRATAGNEPARSSRTRDQTSPGACIRVTRGHAGCVPAGRNTTSTTRRRWTSALVKEAGA